MLNLKPTRLWPHLHKEWKRTAEGARSAKLYTDNGLVEIFAFPGGQIGGKPHRAFTSLEMYLHPYVYQVTLPRCYHDRWLMRLAADFAFTCKQMAEKQT